MITNREKVRIIKAVGIILDDRCNNLFGYYTTVNDLVFWADSQLRHDNYTQKEQKKINDYYNRIVEKANRT